MSRRYGLAKAMIRLAVPRLSWWPETSSLLRIDRSMLHPAMPPPDIGLDIAHLRVAGQTAPSGRFSRRV